MAILCDSRGEFTILLVDLLSAGCEILESREGSDYPLVSSSTLIVKGKEQKEVMMAAIGDTAGEVCVWVIPVSKGKEEEREEREEREEGGYRKVVKYNAHAMGTNSVHLSALERRGQEYTRLLLCSGGDDQSITVCLLDFHAREEREEERVQVLACCRFEGCMGSAVKGITYLSSPLSGQSGHLVGVGYDQRLSLWKLHLNESALEREERTGGSLSPIIVTRMPRDVQTKEGHSGFDVGLEWLTGCLVNIGDINALHLVSDICNQAEMTAEESMLPPRRVALVVGEGFQVFELNVQ